MPDFDHDVDIKVHVDGGLVTAEFPLAGHASPHWLSLFHNLAAKHWHGQAPGAEAEDRPDRTWVIVRTPADGPFSDPVSLLDDVSAVVREASASEQQSNSDTAHSGAAIRSWWARQQR